MIYTDNQSNLLIKKNTFVSLLVLFGVMFAGFCLAQFFSLVVAFILVGFDLSAAYQVISPPFEGDNQRNILLVVQGVNSFILFIVSPLFYLKYYENSQASRAFDFGEIPLIKSFPLTLLLVFLYFPFSAYAVGLNENFQFPEGFAAFEEFARALEEQLQQVTKFLINFDSPWGLILGLIVVAVLPGIGEELFFRGVLQNKLNGLFGNVHVAIWVTAFLFSAFHFQFYGLLPRMLLGALFGYLYIWSGTLTVPMFAHFLNNGVTLLMVYLYNQGLIETNIESSGDISIGLALVSLVLVSIVLLFFRKLTNSQTPVMHE
ncbi:CPBP family intramembrane glutamic endopeptidase [Flexithrix dorotheae]|uniref:CPBP family intramembrane glutamic endopeptidase n=1 Tax=Flexithrix dorotheae TaxID=70993 RepID=UPI00036F2AB1|nr:CPBP family intramembrane glutamic endopeptidase [Flexithrix dorotheae]